MTDSEVNLSELCKQCLELYQYDIVFKREKPYSFFLYQYLNLYLVIHGIRNMCLYTEYIGNYSNDIPYIDVPLILKTLCKSIHLRVEIYNIIPNARNYFIFKDSPENMELYRQIHELHMKDSHELVGRFFSYMTPFNIKTRIRSLTDKQCYLAINSVINMQETTSRLLPQIVVDKSNDEIQEYYLHYLNFINDHIENLNLLFLENEIDIVITNASIIINKMSEISGGYKTLKNIKNILRKIKKFQSKKKKKN